MKLLSLLSLISLGAASPIESSPSFPSVEVKIENIGNTTVKATVASHHDTDLNILKLGSIIDDVDLERVNVFSGGKCFDPCL